MNHDHAPLFEALQEHMRKKTTSFHVPGHKFGRSLVLEEQNVFHSIMQFDMTEITGLDDLHQPEGCIREAQELAADAFGADETYFLVGGSTAGNLAAILALCQEGDTIIVERGSHKSVINGLMLAKAKAVFLPQSFDPNIPFPLGPSLDSIRQALELYPEAKGVLLTSPNYYGNRIDLQEAAKLVHQYDIPLIVDEAHGAHFGFHPDLPPSALRCGADVVIQSTHKMLTAMTMGSMLHVKGAYGEHLNDKLKYFLSMLQSSSPSYPIMASLDMARRYMIKHGAAQLDRSLQYLKCFSEQLTELRVIWHSYSRTNASPHAFDPMKCYIADATRTLSGHQLRALLEAEGCIMEMSDRSGVLAAFGVHTTESDLDRLLSSLKQIVEKYKLQKKEVGHNPLNCFTRAVSLTMIDLKPSAFEECEIVTFEQAVHRKSAQMVIPYPPGIPLWYPGEEITADSVRELQHWIEQGGHVQGITENHMLKVIHEKG